MPDFTMPASMVSRPTFGRLRIRTSVPEPSLTISAGAVKHEPPTDSIVYVSPAGTVRRSVPAPSTNDTAFVENAVSGARCNSCPFRSMVMPLGIMSIREVQSVSSVNCTNIGRTDVGAPEDEPVRTGELAMDHP